MEEKYSKSEYQTTYKQYLSTRIFGRNIFFKASLVLALLLNAGAIGANAYVEQQHYADTHKLLAQQLEKTSCKIIVLDSVNGNESKVELPGALSVEPIPLSICSCVGKNKPDVICPAMTDSCDAASRERCEDIHKEYNCG